MSIEVIHGDCLDVLRGMPDASVDAVVTDPPYELGFMGRKWDSQGIAYSVALWSECLRVLKPGGHLLGFGGTRTYHRMTVAIEDAGFEVRDSLHWIYGQGFPKSLDVSKAIDKAAGESPRVVGPHPTNQCPGGEWCRCSTDGRSFSPTKHAPLTAPATDAAREWQGWGTALKPAHEPIVVARKPLIGTVAANVAQHGTGAINVDACRVAHANDADRAQTIVPQRSAHGSANLGSGEGRNGEMFDPGSGRWPPNVILTHSADCANDCAPDCPVALMDRQSGERPSGGVNGVRKGGPNNAMSGANMPRAYIDGREPDSGGASRFFPTFEWDPFIYQAKASKRDRGEGNKHPTVKPTALMRWLVRLVTPKGGTVLDPFAGSGTTLVAAQAEGVSAIGIEREAEYVEIIKRRIGAVEAA